MITPILTDQIQATRGGPPGGGGTPIKYSTTLAQLLDLYLANGAGGGGGGGGDVASVFGRTGVVTADAADYAAYYARLAANNSFTGINGQTGAQIQGFTAMPALEVDVSKFGNSYSATGNVTFTYSSASPTAGTTTLLRITADGTARTITIPSTYSLARGGNITTLAVPANTTLEVRLQYLSSRWEVIGDPVATTGSGGFVLATGATLTSPTYTESTISASAIDWATASDFYKTLAANTTFTFSNAANGKTIVVAITNTASNYTVAWPGGVLWSGGVAPTQTIGAKTDVYTFIQINGVIYGSVVQNF